MRDMNCVLPLQFVPKIAHRGVLDVIWVFVRECGVRGRECGGRCWVFQNGARATVDGQERCHVRTCHDAEWRHTEPVCSYPPSLPPLLASEEVRCMRMPRHRMDSHASVFPPSPPPPQTNCAPMVGRPTAMASSKGSPQPSPRDGSTTAWTALVRV